MDIVDTHTHVVSDDTQKYPPAPVGGKRSGWSEAHGVTADEFARYTEQAGVKQALVVHSSTTYGFDNSYAADSVARFPDRFVGVCAVDGEAPDAPERLRYWITERGMSGVRFYPKEGDTWVDGPAGYPLWEEVQRLQIPVAISGRRMTPQVIRGAAERYPSVPILLDHMLNPSMDRADEYFAPAALPNVHVKFTSVNLKRAKDAGVEPGDFLAAVVDRFGSKRVMWGSNFPSAFGSPNDPYKELLDEMRIAAEALSEADREWFFAGTARSLYRALNRVRA